jgi:hypothetical protein
VWHVAFLWLPIGCMQSTLSQLALHLQLSILLIDSNLHLIFCVKNVYGNISWPWIHFYGSLLSCSFFVAFLWLPLKSYNEIFQMLFLAAVQNLWLPCYFLVTFLWLSCDSHATFLQRYYFSGFLEIHERSQLAAVGKQRRNLREKANQPWTT